MREKKRWISIILHMLFPGAGHSYIGQYKKALTLALLSFILLSSIFILTNIYLFIMIILLALILYFYPIFDLWGSFSKNDKFTAHIYSRWYFVLLFVIIGSITTSFVGDKDIDLMQFRTFIISSKGMQNTFLKDDMLIAKKENKLKRGDVIIFHYPQKPQIYFAKRLVAKEGDEILYIDSALLLHTIEGDSYIKANYSKKDIVQYLKKLWIKNPYKIDNKNIQNTKDKNRDRSLFEIMAAQYNIKDFNIKAIFLEDQSLKKYNINSKIINAFYHKVGNNSYFVLGDNREQSNDSRFWGDVPDTYVYGVAKMILFNYHHLNRIGTTVK